MVRFRTSPGLTGTTPGCESEVSGLNPVPTAFEDVPTNPAVHVATFELPKGDLGSGDAKALPELRDRHRTFREIDREWTDASTLVLLNLQHDLMPKELPVDPDRVTDDQRHPLGVRVRGAGDLGSRQPRTSASPESRGRKVGDDDANVTGALFYWDVVVVDPMAGGLQVRRRPTLVR